MIALLMLSFNLAFLLPHHSTELVGFFDCVVLPVPRLLHACLVYFSFSLPCGLFVGMTFVGIPKWPNMPLEEG